MTRKQSGISGSAGSLININYMAKKEYTFEEICRSIQSRNFAPIYFLMGEEPFFIDKITDLLIERVLKDTEKDFNQLIFYGSDTDVATIINAAKRFPMMSDYQLIVVKEAQSLRNIESLSNYLKKILPSTILVINYKYKSYDKRKTLLGLVEKCGIVFESKKIPDYKMPGFITASLRQKSIGIDPKAAQMLADFLGNDLNRLDKELDKLGIILSEIKSNKITPELVEENIGISKEFNNFELLRAIIAKDNLKAYRIAQYFEKNPQNNPIQATLVVLFNYFSNLLICYYTKDRSEAGIMAALGLKASFQVKDYTLGMKQYPAMKVFNLIGEIRTADALSKGFGCTDLIERTVSTLKAFLKLNSRKSERLEKRLILFKNN